jgi:predicted permease
MARCHLFFRGKVITVYRELGERVDFFMQFPVSIIIREVGQICLLLTLGFLFVKFGVLKDDNLPVISALLMKAALPSMIITIIPVTAPRDMLLKNSWFIIVLAVWYIILAAFGYITGKLCRFPPNTMRVHIVHSMIGNIFVIGLPLVIAAVGPTAGVTIAMVAIVDQFMLWFVAVPLSYPAASGRRSPKQIFMQLANPLTAALFISIGFILAGGLPDNLLIDALRGVGGMAKPLAMFFIGGTIALQDLRKAERLCGFFIILLGKMIALPITFFWLTGFFTQWLDMPSRLALVIFTSLPCLASMCFLSKTNGTDYEYANMTMLLTTVSSIVTIPLVAYLVNFLIV